MQGRGDPGRSERPGRNHGDRGRRPAAERGRRRDPDPRPTGADTDARCAGQAGMLGNVKFATFDLSPEVLQAITDGDMLFAIDQAAVPAGLPADRVPHEVPGDGRAPAGQRRSRGPHRTADRHGGHRGRTSSSTRRTGSARRRRVGAHAIERRPHHRRPRPTSEGDLRWQRRQPSPPPTGTSVSVASGAREAPRPPELGAIAGLIVVWVFFAIIAGRQQLRRHGDDRLDPQPRGAARHPRRGRRAADDRAASSTCRSARSSASPGMAICRSLAVTRRSGWPLLAGDRSSPSCWRW